MNKNLLAVYGTLKRGHGNNRLLRNAKFLGETKTKPEFTMFSCGGFPTLNKNGNTEITVEIFEVDDDTLQSVYSLEGYHGKRDHPSNWYDTVDVETNWGTAEMFYWKENQTNKLQVVETGCW